MPVHPPKVETFDVPGGTNTDSKGLVRPVEVYREEPFGLYMARPMVDRPTSSYVESWLLPALGLRVTDWWWRSGHERDQDYYLDVVDIDRAGEIWRTTDHYLDLLVRNGREVEVIDVDEFVAAVADGVLDQQSAQRALHRSHRAATGIARHRHDLDRWLAEHGVVLSWLRRAGSPAR